MFLRQNKRRKNGKTHRYFSVVENRRTGGGATTQRQVMKGGHQPILPHQPSVLPRRLRFLRQTDGPQGAFLAQRPGRPLRPAIIAVRPAKGYRETDRGKFVGIHLR